MPLADTDVIRSVGYKNMAIAGEKHLEPGTGRLVLVAKLKVVKDDSANHSLPSNKSQLVELLKSNIVIPFHKTVCPQCHKIPKALEWPQAEIKPGMNVFHVGKRMKPFQHWEPIYIGTNQEPWYDERLTWEGRSDKMAQGFKLCLLNYEFHILDNAFLIHR